jgi:ABC-type taurine transport system ATPase subunit
MVAGLIRPSSGSIRVAGARVSGPGPEGYAANAILVRIERWALSWKQDAQGAEIV